MTEPRPDAMDERKQINLAAAAWALSGPFGPIIPMVIFARQGGKSRFVAYHSLQAALSYIFLLAAGVAFGLILLVLTGIHMAMYGMPETGAAPPASIATTTTLGAATMGVIYVGLVIGGFVFAGRARDGNWAKYPVVYRLAASILAKREDQDEDSKD